MHPLALKELSLLISVGGVLLKIRGTTWLPIRPSIAFISAGRPQGIAKNSLRQRQ